MSRPNELCRRDFVAAGTAAVLGVVSGCRPTRPAPPALGADELAELSAVDAIAAMTKGEVTAERYAGVLLDRCEQWKSLNAFITLAPDRVLAAARAADQARRAGRPLGALHGLPIPIKDSVNTKDLPTTAGTRGLARFQPAEDAPIVARLRAAGGFVLGKTNLHEMSFGWTSSNQAFGPVRNPYDPTRIPGGSSGGTAAAVAARMAPLGVAEDTEGSIRVPAAMCGIAGFRPTTGRYPSTGVVPITALFDQVGPHARAVEDLILFDQVATGDRSRVAARNLAGVKLATVRSYYFAGLDPEVDQLTAKALGNLRAAGVEVIEADLPELPKLIGLVTGAVQIHDAYFTVKQYLADYRTGLTIEQLVDSMSPPIRDEIRRYVMPGGKDAVSEAYYHAATTEHLPELRAAFRKLFAETGASAVVFPTAMTPPVKIGEDREVEVAGRKIPFETAISRNIAPGSTTGLPGLVLPIGLTTGGLPVTIELDGPSGSDRDLLALGLGIETVLGHLPAPRIPAR